MTPAQRRLLHVLLGDLAITSREDRLQALSHLTGRPIESSNDLTADEYDQAVNHFQAVLSWPSDERTAEVDILTRSVADPWARAS